MKITVPFLEFAFLNELPDKEPILIAPWEYLLHMTIWRKLPESFVMSLTTIKIVIQSRGLNHFFLATLSYPIWVRSCFWPQLSTYFKQTYLKIGHVYVIGWFFNIFSFQNTNDLYENIRLHTTLIFFNCFHLFSVEISLIVLWRLLSVCQVLHYVIQSITYFNLSKTLTKKRLREATKFV